MYQSVYLQPVLVALRNILNVIIPTLLFQAQRYSDWLAVAAASARERASAAAASRSRRATAASCAAPLAPPLPGAAPPLLAPPLFFFLLHSPGRLAARALMLNRTHGPPHVQAATDPQTPLPHACQPRSTAVPSIAQNNKTTAATPARSCATHQHCRAASAECR